MATEEHREGEAEEVDAEIVHDDEPPAPPATALAPVPAASGGSGEVVTLWNTRNPGEIVQAATDVATALKDIIEKQGLAKNLGGRKKHVEIEGWQTAGTLLGAQAMTVDTQRVEPVREFPVKTHRKKYGWVNGKREVTEEYTDEWTCQGWSFDAVAEVRTLDGRIIGRGEATCSREEENWLRSTDSAVKGMAQTRACSRALRQALGFIVGLAGYSATPQEEMEAEGFGPTLDVATEGQKDKLRQLLKWLLPVSEAEQAWGEIKALFDGELYGPAVDAVCAVLARRKAIADAEASPPAEAEQKREGGDNGD